MSKSIKTAAATAVLLIGLTAHSEVAEAQRWDGWHGFGWGGGGFRGAVLPGVGWRGGWGGDGGGWGRPAGWGRPWGWSYYRPWRRPWYGPGVIGAGAGWGWPYYSNVASDSCYQLRPVWTYWGWRRQWVNVCWGGYGGYGGSNGGWGW